MIVAHVRHEDSEDDHFRGPCEFPALPPIGGHIRVMDRNANLETLRVVDVVVSGVSLEMEKEVPGGLRPYDGSPLRVTIIVSEMG
jgi:hypothetical protein